MTQSQRAFGGGDRRQVSRGWASLARIRWLGLARAAGTASAAVGAVVLLGWVLDVAVLKSVVPGRVAMKANTALGFVVAGMGLWLTAREAGVEALRGRISRLLGLAVATMAVLTLAEYASGRSFGIDQLLFHEPTGAVGTLAPGRMAPASAVSFLLAGVALAVDRRRPGRAHLVNVLALAAAVPALVAGLALLYGAPNAFGLGRNTQMAVPTIAGFLALSVGLLCLLPDCGLLGLLRRDGAAGTVARRLIPAAVLLPATVGLLKVTGDRAGFWEPRFGVVLVAVAHMLVYSSLVVWVVWSLTRADQARLRVEAELQASERRFRTLFEQSPAARLLIDATSDKLVHANAAAVAFYGYPPERLRAMTIGELNVTGTREAIEPAETEGQTHFLARHRLASGEIRDVEVHTGTIEAGERTLLESVIHDVTEKLRDAAALRESHAFNEALLETIPFGIDIVDRSGVVLFMNHAMKTLADAGPLGRHCWEIYKDDGRQCEDCPLGRPIAVGKTDTTESSGVLGGRTFEISHTGMLYRGEPALLEVFNDITARKELEDRVRVSENMEAVGRLAGGVAHDFNNVLSIVNGYAELALHRMDGNGPFQHEFEQILSAGERAKELTHQLLALGRKQMLQPRALDLNAVAAETEKLLHRLLGEDIEITSALAPDLGHVRADPGQLGQVLMNLAINARDAMVDGGTLRIETANVDLDDQAARMLGAFQPGPYVALSVSDTGRGMGPDTKARAFEPFFTTKPGAGNAGLGLATVYGIIDQLGGAITLHSKEGAGTTFKLYFPRVEEAIVEAVAPQAPSPRGGNERILVVEDEDAVRGIIVQVLEDQGYLVTPARGAAEAIELAGTEHDLLLTDVVMPKMNGRQLADRLVSKQPDLRVIFMSGYTGTALAERSGLDGAIDFLQKPISLPKLIETVREVIDRHPHDASRQLSATATPEN